MRTSAPLPVGREKTEAVRALFDAIAPRYELVNHLMTFGLDARWRRRTVRLLGLAPGSLVGDLACGTGDFCRLLRAGGMQAVGCDLSLGMLRAAHAGAPLVQGDAEHLPLADGVLDGLVSGFALRNFTDLPAALGEAARVVRAGGRVAFLEVDTPANPVVVAGHRIWFNDVAPRLGSLFSDREAYRYLPRSVAYLPPRAELLARFADAGFADVAHHRLSAGVTQVVTATRRGARPW